jgi:hypothetical protein
LKRKNSSELLLYFCRGGKNQFVVGFIPFKKMDSTMGTFNGEVQMRTNQHVDGV